MTQMIISKHFLLFYVQKLTFIGNHQHVLLLNHVVVVFAVTCCPFRGCHIVSHSHYLFGNPFENTDYNVGSWVDCLRLHCATKSSDSQPLLIQLYRISLQNFDNKCLCLHTQETYSDRQNNKIHFQ